MFRKLLDSGEAGDNVGVLLRGTKREEVERGQVLSAPGSIKPYSKFKGELIFLQKMRVEDIHHFLVIIAHSFILEQRMLQVRLNCQLEQKW